MVAGNSLQGCKAVAGEDEVGIGDVTECGNAVHDKVPHSFVVECTHVVVAVTVLCPDGKEQCLLGESE